MTHHDRAIFVTVGLSLLAALADYFLKRASGADRPFRTSWFVAGFAIYGLTAFGTVYVFRHLKVAATGAIYSVALVLFLAILGVVVFRERLSGGEVLGIVLAIGALILLGRF